MKKISILLIIFVMMTSVVQAAPIYTDNVAGMLSELNIINGDPDGNMRYDDLVSRAECTKIAVSASVYRDNVATGSKSSPFSDVKYTHWAAPYVTVGVQNGLCKGYLDATFRPDNNVLYEEAATMFLKVLGYTDEDFGGSYPEAQVGLAENIGILDFVDKTVGEALTRRDVAKIAYNTLNTAQKNSQSDLITTFERTIVDDVVLVSTMAEDKAVPEGKIYTSAGTYNMSDDFDKSMIGRRGSMVLRGNDTIVSFIPYDEGVDNRELRMVYSTLGNSIITYDSGSFSQIDIDNSVAFFRNSSKITADAALLSLEMGDTLQISYKSNGDIDYIVCTNGDIIGPKTIASSNWCSAFGADSSSITVMRDGVKSSVSEVRINDVGYYIPELKLALVYSKKVTGIYEDAQPAKDAPTSITVSGKTYNLEGVNAFEKLSSGGKFNYGDSITLLLGRSGEVADVLDSSSVGTEITGFLSAVGTKQTIVSGTTVTKPYIQVVLSSGEVCEYITEKKYESYLNRVVSIKFKDGLATISPVTQNHKISGKVTWDSESGSLGSQSFSSDVKIIEVSTTDSYETASFATVYPQRLNGIKLSENDILYISKNTLGNIDEMILKDVTGDIYTYGIITHAKNNSGNGQLSGSYEYIVNGTEYSLSTNGQTFGVSAGQAVKIRGDVRNVMSMTPLFPINATKITDVSGSSITMNNNKYTMSDKVQIYAMNSSYGYLYTMITVDELSEKAEEYTASVYMDKTASSGGQVRVIILHEK